MLVFNEKKKSCLKDMWICSGHLLFAFKIVICDLIYLLRKKYLQHSSWLHSTLCKFTYENRGCSLQQVLPQNFERNWNLVFKAFDSAFKRLCKRIFLSILSTHNRTEKKKGESSNILLQKRGLKIQFRIFHCFSKWIITFRIFL